MNGTMNLPAARRSPGAFRLYRELVEKANQSPTIVATDFCFTDAEMTWCDLTELEAETFGIDPRLLNALVMAYMRYESLAGLLDAEFEEFPDGHPNSPTHGHLKFPHPDRASMRR